MKKILILTIIIGVIFASCGFDGDVSEKMKSPNYGDSNTRKLSSSEEGQIEENSGIEIYNDFLELINDGKKPFELIEFLDKEVKNVAYNVADDMILALEEVQNIYEGYYQEELFASDFTKKVGSDFISNDFKGNENIIDKAKGTEFNELVEEIINGGYKFVSQEGAIYPIVDYSFLKKYSDFISNKVASYIDIKSNQSDNPVAIDAALVVSLDEIEDRLLEIESHVDKYTDFKQMEHLKSIYYNYIIIYLVGVDNTPAYDYDTKKYKDEVILKINDTTTTYEGTKTAEITNNYLNIIKKDNYTFTKNAEEFINNLREKSFNNKTKHIYTNNIFTKLLPEKSGYIWNYNGMAEYIHQMELSEIEIVADKGIMKYIITGSVLDMSDGESGNSPDYYKTDLVYEVKNGALIQTKIENIMMDSEFDKIELIRAPLIRGNKWGQGVIDKSGEYRYINCEITDISEVAGSKVYTVEYKEDNGYYEIRMIEEGIGVVSFTKLWQTDDGDFEIGYSLNKEHSGY